MKSLTKRRQVNERLDANVNEFVELTQEVLRGTEYLTRANYDLRDYTTKECVDFLKITIESTHTVKKNWILVRKSIDSVLFCLDWYINRVNIDLKKYREKLHGETQIIPSDEFDIPDWE